METKTIQKPKHKIIVDGFVEEIIYTVDTKVFNTEKQALAYELSLKQRADFRNKYHHSEVKISGKTYDALIIDELTKENIVEITREFPEIIYADLRVGLNLIYTDNSGDYEYQYISHPEDMISYYETKIEELKAVINTGSK